MAKPINSIDQPNQSSNKYYASGDRSVIAGTALGGVRQPIRPNPTPAYVDPNKSRQADLQRSSDVYYANDNKSPRSLAAPALLEENPGLVLIRELSEVNSKIDIAIARVRDGETNVPVALGNKDWLTAAMLRRDQAVTREELTEDQGREIKFGLMALPAPEPAKSSEQPALIGNADEAEQFAFTGPAPESVLPDPEDELPVAAAPEQLDVVAKPVPLAEAEDDSDDDGAAFAVPGTPVVPVKQATPTVPPVVQEDDSDDSDDAPAQTPEKPAEIKEEAPAAASSKRTEAPAQTSTPSSSRTPKKGR